MIPSDAVIGIRITSGELFRTITICVATGLIPWRGAIRAGKCVDLMVVFRTDRPRDGFKPRRYTQQSPLKRTETHGADPNAVCLADKAAAQH